MRITIIESNNHNWESIIRIICTNNLVKRKHFAMSSEIFWPKRDNSYCKKKDGMYINDVIRLVSNNALAQSNSMKAHKEVVLRNDILRMRKLEKIPINLKIISPKNNLSLIFVKAEPDDNKYNVICSRRSRIFYKKGPMIEGRGEGWKLKCQRGTGAWGEDPCPRYRPPGLSQFFS